MLKEAVLVLSQETGLIDAECSARYRPVKMKFLLHLWPHLQEEENAESKGMMGL